MFETKEKFNVTKFKQESGRKFRGKRGFKILWFGYKLARGGVCVCSSSSSYTIHIYSPSILNPPGVI